MKSSIFYRCGLFLLLILITRGVLLFTGYIHADEALFALSAKIWQNGGIPYADFFENKPLGVYVFYRFAAWLFGHSPDISIRAIHLALMLWTLLTALVLTQMGDRLAGKRAGNWAGVLFILFSSFWGPDIIAGHIEVVLLLPWCLAIDCLLRPPEHLTISHSFLAGLCASAAFLCKIQAGILLPIAGLYLLWIYPKNLASGQHQWKRALIQCFAFGLGFTPLMALMLLYLHHVGGIEEFFFWNLNGNFSYISQGNRSIPFFRQMSLQVMRYVGSTLLLWILVVKRLIQFRKKNTAMESLLWLWLFLSFIPVAVGKRFEDHYFLFLTPSLCILAALEISAWSQQTWDRTKRWVLAGLLLPTLGFSLSRLYLAIHSSGGEENLLSFEPYARHVIALTKPSDKLFIWGCAPIIYLEAQRMPASRFLRTDTLAGRVAGSIESFNSNVDFRDFIMPGVWERFWQDMRSHPPALILDMAPTGLHDFSRWPSSQYPQLVEWIDLYYIPLPDFMGAKIFQLKTGVGR